MTDSGQSVIPVAFVTRSDATWRFEHEGAYMEARKERLLRDDRGGAGVTVEVGWTGISEEPSHAVTLPPVAITDLLDWLPR